MDLLALHTPSGRGLVAVVYGVVVLSAAATAAAQDDPAGDYDPAAIENPEEGLIGPSEPEETEHSVDQESAFDAGGPEYDDTDSVAEDDSGSGEAEGGALLLGGKVGGALPFNDLGANVAGAIEAGYLFSRGGLSLGALLDVSYFVPQADGTANDARLSGSDDGGYSWHAWQKEFTFQPTFLLRLAMLSKTVVPYAGIGPRLYLLETVVDGKAGDASFPITRERSMKFGVGLPLGVEIALGPGGLIGELLFQWGPLDHELTGDTHLGSTTLWLGYRALL